jgi:hypothetical protein
MPGSIQQAVITLFRAFFNICLLRKKPQDLPSSYDLLLICLFLYATINSLLALTTTTPGNAVLSGVLETFLVSVITLGILKLNRHPERWVQTLTALTGTGCILGILALPLFSGALLLNTGDLLQVLLVILYLILIIWSLAIMGHILRHALDTTMGVGVVFAIFYILITSLLIGAFISGTVVE